MNILVVGNGARECAIAMEYDLQGHQVWITPSNDFAKLFGQSIKCLDYKVTDIEGIVGWVNQMNKIKAEEHPLDRIKNSIHIVVVGGETSMILGLVDELEEIDGLEVLGANKQAAQLEASKDFAKQFMRRHKVLTPAAKTFRSEEFADAKECLLRLEAPYVIKYDGLAGGKGVFICQTDSEAFKVLEDLLVKQTLGNEGVLLEEFIAGFEVSFTIKLDKKGEWKALINCQDHKRLKNGDKGPNTGGMGVVAPILDPETEAYRRVNAIVKRTIDGMKQENLLYNGYLFFGLMFTEDNCYVLEFNTRLGDPEAQVIVNNEANTVNEFTFGGGGFINVILASENYPEDTTQKQKARPIVETKTITRLLKNPNLRIYSSGNVIKDGWLYQTGGRILSVVGIGDTYEEARELAYSAVNELKWDGCQYRTDIGKSLEKMQRG